jgi:hypothetical protein
LSTIKIYTDKGVTILIDPTNQEFRDAIASHKKGSIKRINISGHGSPSYISIEEGEGEGLYYDRVNGQIVYTDDLKRKFADDIRDKLANDAVIEFDGCNTAREIPFTRKDNIAKQTSRELPGIAVSGNKGFGVGNEISNPRNRNQFVRLGRQTHVIGFKRKYLNGTMQ